MTDQYLTDQEVNDNVITLAEVRRRVKAADEEDIERKAKHAELQAFEEAVNELAEKMGVEAFVLATMLVHPDKDDPGMFSPCYHAIGANFGGRPLKDVHIILDGMADKFDALTAVLLEEAANPSESDDE